MWHDDFLIIQRALKVRNELRRSETLAAGQPGGDAMIGYWEED